MSKIIVEEIKHDLPIDEELELHKKGWRIQRIGWMLLFVFIVLALLGLFGEGPLSTRTVQAGNIKIKYDRFCRNEHETELKFKAAGENITTISLSQEYLDKFKFSKIVPEPDKQIASAGYINYVFKGDENFDIIFYLDPSEYGSVKGAIKINAHTIYLKQFIYP